MPYMAWTEHDREWFGLEGRGHAALYGALLDLTAAIRELTEVSRTEDTEDDAAEQVES